jgi:phosphoglycerate kinase
MKYLSELKNRDLLNKTCLWRVDLNIHDSELKNSLRIKGILPTIKYLLNNRCRIVILSHKGRPANKVGDLSLRPAALFLEKTLRRKIIFINNFNFAAIKKRINDSPAVSIFMLENLRFLAGEEKNSKTLAKKLASLGDFYVNDAFGVSHRANASVVAITKFIPAYAGFLMENEISNLNRVACETTRNKRGLIIVLGGAKISDKIVLIKNFLKGVKGQKSKVSCFLIGGGMANTFFAAQGLPVGESLYEKHMIPKAQNLMKQAGRKFFLPSDVMIDNGKILDIGPKTTENYAKIIKKAKTIIWNGPMGYFENPEFAKGSETVAKAILKSKAFSAIGGGETTSLFQIPNSKFQNPKLFLSTGGGAMLEYLADKKLPGIEALK